MGANSPLDTSQVQPLAVNCGGGLLLDRSPYEMPPGSALQLQNFEPDIEGGYRRINGFTTFSSTALTGSGAVLGIATLGANVIGCRGANVETGTGGTWTSITTARTSAGKYHFDKYDWTGTEILVMASGQAGTNYAATWDGSAYALLDGSAGSGSGTAPTDPEIVVEHRGHVFLSQGRALTFTAPFSANNFTPADGAGEIGLPSSITGLKSFRDRLIIFCLNSIFQLTGTSRENFNLQPISRNVGCLSGWSVQEAGGDIVFLARDGLRTIAGTEKIDDVEIGSFSRPIQDRLNSISDFDNVSSMPIREKSQYRIFYPESTITANTSPGTLAALTKTTGPEGTPGLGWEFADLLGIRPSYCASDYVSSVEHVLHGGWTDGIIYRQEKTISFNGTAISAVYQTPHYNFGDVNIRKVAQKIITTIKYEGTVSANLEIKYDFDSDDTPQPARWTLSTPSYVAVYGGGIYGTSVYGADPTATDRILAEGSGFTMSLLLTDTSTNQSFSIKAFQIDAVPGGRR